MSEYNLEGATYFAKNGIDRVPLAKEIPDSAKLLNLLSKEWLPYIECSECGRWKWCPYGTESHTANPHRSLERQCGVAKQALKVFLDTGLPLLGKALKPIGSDFLDAAYHLCQYIFRTEQAVGNFLDDGIIRYYQQCEPLLTTNLKYLRRHLDCLCSSLRNMPEYHSTQNVLLVEGESELRFLKRMVTSSFAWFAYTEYDTYSGAGNRKSNRISMLLRHYHAKGYDVYLQIDADGKDPLQVRETTASTLGLRIERVFAFSHDFETSIPQSLAIAALAIVLDKPGAEIVDIASSLGASITIRELLGRCAPEIRLDDIKVELSHAVGDLLATHYRWHVDKKFMQTELGRFLAFAKKV